MKLPAKNYLDFYALALLYTMTNHKISDQYYIYTFLSVQPVDEYSRFNEFSTVNK